jgi:eukaryotic-like serine/threonine-protein kinase
MPDHQERTVIRRACLACGGQFAANSQVCPNDGAALVDVQRPIPTQELLNNRFRILDLVGEGGMGVVYKAEDEQSKRVVAVKMLHAHLMSDPYLMKRFQQEGNAASCLKHPHIIALYDFGVTSSGQPYHVLEFLEGTSLAEVLQDQGGLTVRRCLKIFEQFCDGLAHAHQRGVIHRDLKPSNIMLVKQDGDPDFVKIVDFGIAKLLPESGQSTQHLTKTGEVFGSPLYMSPEQCMGQKLDARSDIYTTGCVIYEALTGKPPLRGSTMFDTMEKHVTCMPSPLSSIRRELSDFKELQAVLWKAMAKVPEQRQEDMLQLKKELQDAIRNRATQAALQSNLLGTHHDPTPDIKKNLVGLPGKEPARPAKTGSTKVAWRIWMLALGASMLLLALLSQFLPAFR